MNDPLRWRCAGASRQVFACLARLRGLATILAGCAALTGVTRPAEAGLLDVRPWLTQTVESSVRSLDPLIDLTYLPWPYAHIHNVERTDRFTNTSLDTTLTLTAATAMALDPEQLGIADLTGANAEAAEQAAWAAHSDYSLWGSDVLPYDAGAAVWIPPGVRAVDGAGLSLQFPLTLEPQESAWLVSRAYNIGTIASMGELLIGWKFEGATSGWTPPSMGDVNADGQINLADFGVLKANVGADNANWFQGDMDGDGKVTLSDFGLFKRSFGASAAPEPSTLALALLGLGIVTARWRRGPQSSCWPQSLRPNAGSTHAPRRSTPARCRAAFAAAHRDPG